MPPVWVPEPVSQPHLTHASSPESNGEDQQRACREHEGQVDEAEDGSAGVVKEELSDTCWR